MTAAVNLTTDVDAARAHWDANVSPGEVHEVRIPKSRKGPRRFYRTVSGYFDNADAFAEAIAGITGDDAEAVYLTLSPVNPALIARATNRLKNDARETTADTDVIRRTNILLDFDPVRPSGISATEAQRDAALAFRDDVLSFLSEEMGWSQPVSVLATGNGGGLIYRVDLPNDDESRRLVQSILDGLAATFNTDAVKVDTSTANAARIAKIAGTVAAKGDNLPDYPWRLATGTYPPDAAPVPPESLARVAALAPEPVQRPSTPSTNGHHSERKWDIRDVLQKKGIGFDEKGTGYGTVLSLDRCLTSDDHTDGVAIIEMASGALVYRCLHDRCAGKEWRDVRSMLGLPEAQGGAGLIVDGVRYPTVAARANGASPEQEQEPELNANAPNASCPLDDVHTFLGRFVAYPSDHAHVAHTLWVAHTHMMDAWESTPRIAFLSPEPASGKTRALEATELLVPNPVEAINVTPAYLFRKVGHEDGPPTVLFDEIDTVFGPKAKDNEEVRGLLNAGHRRGAVAGRCVVRGKIVDTEEIPAYCAVALAGLGEIPDTILSRSIVIRMRRRGPGERIEAYRRRIVKEEGHHLAKRLAAWADTIRDDVTGAWPDMPDGIDDRDSDVWESLLAVADAAGGDWPERARVSAVTHVTLSKESTPSLGIRLLKDLRELFKHDDQLFTEDVLSRLHAIDEAPWADVARGKPLNARGLAQRLKQYGVSSHTIRDGSTVLKGYKKEDLYDAWTRYLPPPPLESVTSVTSDTSEPEPDRQAGIPVAKSNGHHGHAPAKALVDEHVSTLDESLTDDGALALGDILVQGECRDCGAVTDGSILCWGCR